MLTKIKNKLWKPKEDVLPPFAQMLIDMNKKLEQFNEKAAGGTFDNGLSFGVKLKKRGFKFIGGGGFSNIYAKDGSDRAIKVCGNPDSWPNYVMWAKEKGYAGTFAPKVFSYKYFKGKNNQPFYVAVVERMKGEAMNMDPAAPMRILPFNMSYALDCANDNAVVVSDLLLPGAKKFIMDYRQDILPVYVQDLKPSNWLERNDGSVCLNDPIAEPFDLRTPGPLTQRFKLANAA